MDTINSDFMSVSQAHELIGTGNISRGSLYMAIQRREIPSVRLGKRILISRSRFLEWLASPAVITTTERGAAEPIR